MENLTIEKLSEYYYNNNHDISKTQTFADSFNPNSYPDKPKKPVASVALHKLTSIELKDLSEKTEIYEKEMLLYKEKMESYRNVQGKINDIFFDFLKEVSGLNTIPEQYRDKVYSKAYSLGHSAGYSEVLHYLLDLIEIFE